MIVGRSGESKGPALSEPVAFMIAGRSGESKGLP